jgi:hypothetical protein
MQNATKKGKAKADIAAIELALERYKDDFGDYPEPASPSRQRVGDIDAEYNAGGAMMLYQALSGDGTNAIKGVGGSASTGEFGRDGTLYLEGLSVAGTAENGYSRGSVISVYRSQGGSDYMLVDPFGVPYQYEKWVEGENEQVRNTRKYDLWSFGTKEAGPAYNPEDNPHTWITNW